MITFSIYFFLVAGMMEASEVLYMKISVSVHKDGNIFLMPHIYASIKGGVKAMYPATILKKGESAYGYTYDELLSMDETVISANA
jgi:hypothetical protein